MPRAAQRFPPQPAVAVVATPPGLALATASHPGHPEPPPAMSALGYAVGAAASR